MTLKIGEENLLLTREGVVFEDDLMNDTRARFPETDTVLSTSGGQKVVDFFVDVLRPGQIGDTLNLGLNLGEEMGLEDSSQP